jgi:hypothetical protein
MAEMGVLNGLAVLYQRPVAVDELDVVVDVLAVVVVVGAVVDVLAVVVVVVDVVLVVVAAAAVVVVGVDVVDVKIGVCCDVATVVPFLFVAVTVTRIVEPLSPARER